MMASTMATLMYVLTLAWPPPWVGWSTWAGGLAWAACASAMARLLRDQVDDGEDGDPDDVHEVPVEAGDLDLRIVTRVELAPHGEAHQDQEPDDTAGDVRAVEAGEHEERRAEQARRQPQPLVQRESRELVDLVEHEVQAQHGRHEQPGRRRLDAVVLQA